jgi:hypothetical protein
MPTISMFYGILVLMFFRDNKQHNLPHIHARYQSDEAAISIEDGAVLDGRLPPKQLKMVQAWIEICRLIGNLRSMAKTRFVLLLCSEVDYVD